MVCSKSVGSGIVGNVIQEVGERHTKREKREKLGEPHTKSGESREKLRGVHMTPECLGRVE